MKWWVYKYLILLFTFSLLVPISYGDANTSSPTSSIQDIEIEVYGINNLPVKEASVEVFSITGQILYYLYTNENGTVSFSGKQDDSYTFVIKAENYEILSKNVTILSFFPEDKIRFTLTPLKNQKDSNSWPIFIPAVVGFGVFIYWYIRFYHGRFIPYPKWETRFFNLSLVALIASWPAIVFILLFFGKENIILYGVSFSVYIPLAALIGILSYLLLSIEEVFCQIIPKCKKKSIEWVYVRRIAIAPYIAILGVYNLLNAASIQNVWFVLLFSFFAGMFTKTIEEWLFKSVQKLLPEDLKKEIERRINYNIENSELVVRLKVDEDAAYTFYITDIRTVEQLAYLNTEVSDKRRERILQEMSLKRLNEIITDANKQIAEIDKLKEVLNLTTSERDLLIEKAKVYSISDFADIDIDSIEGIKGTEKSSLKQKQAKAKEIKNTKDLKLLSLEDLKTVCDISTDKTEYFKILSLHGDIRKTGISDWTANDTKKLLEYDIKTIKDLKNQCATEQGKKAVLEKMKDELPKISKLIEKVSVDI